MQRAVLVEQDLEKIKKLVAEGFDPNSPIGCGTFSPMDGAVQVGNLAMVETLLKLGAAPRGNQLVSTARLDHQTACEIATVLLAAGVSVNGTPDADGGVSSVLHTAVYRNNVGLVTILLKQPGIVLDGFDQDHRTTARDRRRERPTKTLVRHAPCSPGLTRG